VSSGRETGLDLYLLTLLAASAPPYTVAHPAGVWARLLGVASESTAASAISKQWKWLEEEQLVQRVGRRGRWTNIRILSEDGSGRPYRATLSGGRWFQVPFEYWTDNWFGKLNLPGKAVLLIALSLLDDFVLPEEKGPAWYGVSADSVGRGLRALQDHGLLTVRKLQKPAPSAPRGFTVERHYTLQKPFGPKGRRSKTLERAKDIQSKREP
jgi:hypothetical protein